MYKKHVRGKFLNQSNLSIINQTNKQKKNKEKEKKLEKVSVDERRKEKQESQNISAY